MFKLIFLILLVMGGFFCFVKGTNVVIAQEATPNLALGKPIIGVSSVAQDFQPSFVFDGNDQTLWTSGGGGAQWIAVDLGQAVPIGRVNLKWGQNFASSFLLAVSDDGLTWNVVYEVENNPGQGSFHLGQKGRYLLLLLTAGPTSSYQLAEMEVFQAPPPPPPPPATPTPTLTPAPTLEPTPTRIKGDVNGDQRVDLKDLSILMSHFNKTKDFPKELDMDNNGKIDQTDYEELVKVLTENKTLHQNKGNRK